MNAIGFGGYGLQPVQKLFKIEVGFSPRGNASALGCPGLDFSESPATGLCRMAEKPKPRPTFQIYFRIAHNSLGVHHSESSLFPLYCKVNPASHHRADRAGKEMKNLMRIHMLPPQFEPKTPQMTSLKKLNEWKWSWRAPQFVDQTQSAQQREDDDQCVRENAYLHVEPAEILG